MLGNYLVTVTTTGEAGGKAGMCARCEAELKATPTATPTANTAASRQEGALSSPPTGSLCSCWCWGWAEVKVRRPSGNTAWMLRMQNRLQRVHTLGRGEGELAAMAAAYNYPFKEEEGEKTEVAERGETVAGDEEEGRQEEREQGEDKSSDDSDQSTRQQTQSPWQLITLECRGPEIAESPAALGQGPSSAAAGPVTSPSSAAAGPVTSPSCAAAGPVTSPSSAAAGPVTSPCAIERMPPLLSYEEAGPAGRSPSLHGSSLLSEQEQVRPLEL